MRPYRDLTFGQMLTRPRANVPSPGNVCSSSFVLEYYPWNDLSRSVWIDERDRKRAQRPLVHSSLFEESSSIFFRQVTQNQLIVYIPCGEKCHCGSFRKILILRTGFGFGFLWSFCMSGSPWSFSGEFLCNPSRIISIVRCLLIPWILGNPTPYKYASHYGTITAWPKQIKTKGKDINERNKWESENKMEKKKKKIIPRDMTFSSISTFSSRLNEAHGMY